VTDGSNIEVRVEILFVDDEPSVLAGLRRTLRSMREHWNMTFVESPAEALRLLVDKPFDAIVSDYRMHGINGGDLLTLTRREQPKAARLILSGQVEADDIQSLLALAHYCLTKPCGGDELIAAVEDAIRTQRASS
jgi:DNA-binding NarL/FixJ family response regulator